MKMDDGHLDDDPASNQAPKKGRDAENRKAKQIMAAARSLFLEEGFDAVSMDRVTQASGVSKATIYVHFTNKEDLFEAVMTDEARRVADMIWLPEDESEDVEGTLRQIATNFLEVFMSGPAQLFRRATISVVPRLSRIGRAVYDMGPGLLTDRLAGFLTAADKKQLVAIPDPQLAARQFLSIVRVEIDLLGALALDMPDKPQINHQIEEGIKMFMSYYAKAD